jgi:Alpha/beta hydrolase domain
MGKHHVVADRRPAFRRRWALVACCALLCSLFTLVSPAFGAFENVPTPTVEGPIPVTETSHPFLATDIPLANYGYTEQEYFISGTGYTYNTGGAVNVNGSKILTGGPNSNGTYPFKTRIVVRRPTNPANFNGKVVVEWNNVTAGYDLEANWFGDPYYLIKHGYAWVGVSAQAVGTNYLKNTFNPTRYAGLEVGPSGDTLSYDIYGAAIKAVRGFGTGPEPLGSLTPSINKVTASGESQSCGRLVTYFNKIAPLQQIADDYLLTVCTTAIRADRPEKVLRIITEFENKAQQTEVEAPANPSLRHWEATGGSHVPFLAVANWTVPVDRDTGEQIAKCVNPPLSKVQWPYLVNAGTKELNEWQEGGSPPPLAPRGEYVNPTTLKRDAQGNALGGIRLPDMQVATGVNRGDNSAAPPPNPYPSSAFCTLLGQYKPFSEETLSGLYTDFGDYVDKVKSVAETRMNEGFLLPDRSGAERGLAQHRQLPAELARPGAVARTVGGGERPQNKTDVRVAAPQCGRRMDDCGERVERTQILLLHRGRGDLELPRAQHYGRSVVQARTGSDDRHAVVGSPRQRGRRQDGPERALGNRRPRS